MRFGVLPKPGTALRKIQLVGKQIVRSADSVCANIAEGRGRFNDQDNRRFVKIARGSL
ncbi:four helix bundle protein [Mastigocoleus sp. MO_188.B34]|uniref:four helix bundle protein n=1 Tax=Mastigocoleus sp. MO_188.B34 TaxID=3036635 RepID=UPI003451CC02